MKNVFLISGVLLLVLGAVLIHGAYSPFNKYSRSVSEHFDQRHQASAFPNHMLDLNEGDSVAVEISMNGESEGTLFIANTAGEKIVLSGLGNLTAYYHVQTRSEYWFIVYVYSANGTSREFDLISNIEVTTRAPNLLLLVTGIIILLAGAVTIPVTFLYKNLKR